MPDFSPVQVTCPKSDCGNKFTAYPPVAEVPVKFQAMVTAVNYCPKCGTAVSVTFKRD